ncbi:tetratricopeptide repeat protein [Micromonospora mirobrigensis]|uniref:Tetratricopeptide repeat n=1 Tax=Micromonospora mirobrigensis TaxID=262898 RepID=A0A1C4WBU7_9ACTN|nr:tetratricopeptide repeat protein [Micromonospora mirobrigensis]SCE93717.1 Tetratricopeptide repeat [Micromonospora mirobrigensis]
MNAEDRIERARKLYEQAVFGGDADVLADAERGLDAVEADTALARGRILHARFLNERADTGAPPAEDPAELPLFERAAALYQAVGDPRGQAEAQFWIGCLHQVIRRDDDIAVPHLELAAQLATAAGDPPTRAEALRHLGIAAHTAGRLDEARERLEESSRLRREVGALPGVAANLVGLAYIAAAQGRHADALDALDEANSIARAHHAHAVVRQVAQAREQI